MDRDQLPHVAVLVDTATAWGRQIIRGVIRYSDKHGPWHLAIEARGQDECLLLPPGWRGDGVIARIGSPQMLRKLKAAKVPVVNVSGIDLPHNEFPVVTTDYQESAKVALAHFCERGFSRFGYCGLNQTSFGRRHRDAFVNVVKSAGFECSVFSAAGPKNRELDVRAKQRRQMGWLESLAKPVGIFTWATGLGLELLAACRLAQINVPYEVAVLGGNFDELLCTASWPPLSGIRVPTTQIGYEAAAILDRMMRHNERPAQPIFLPPTEVVAQRSTDTLALDDPDIVQALTFIRAQACKSIQIANILKVVPLSRRSLERKFRELLGHSPTEEIRRVKISTARRMLAETDLSIEAISAACGFGTYNYLTRVFTAVHGVSPREYRRKLRGR